VQAADTTSPPALPAARRAALLLSAVVLLAGGIGLGRSDDPQPPAAPDRSPVDVVLTADEQWLLTANQTSHSVSLVRAATGQVVAEVPCGQRPSALTLTPDGRHVLVTCTDAGELAVFALQEDKLTPAGTVRLGFEPRGVAVAPDGRWAYVALTTAHAVAVVDLREKKVADRIAVGRWPRYLALSADGRCLAVGANGDGGVAVIDPVARKQLYQDNFAGLNFGQMQVSADGKYVYTPFIVYRHNPITPNNIRRGWVTASRLGRVRLDGHHRREAIALDPQGRAVSDPFGLALSPDEKHLVSAASGTHELLVYRLGGPALARLRRSRRPHRPEPAQGPGPLRPHPAAWPADGRALQP
jgi:YVTN family beta-propeller protein